MRGEQQRKKTKLEEIQILLPFCIQAVLYHNLEWRVVVGGGEIALPYIIEVTK